jgi:hypothetical protein
MPLSQRASHMERMTSIKNMERRDRDVEKGNIKKHCFWMEEEKKKKQKQKHRRKIARSQWRHQLSIIVAQCSLKAAPLMRLTTEALVGRMPLMVHCFDLCNHHDFADWKNQSNRGSRFLKWFGVWQSTESIRSKNQGIRFFEPTNSKKQECRVPTCGEGHNMCQMLNQWQWEIIACNLSVINNCHQTNCSKNQATCFFELSGSWQLVKCFA